MLAFLNYRPHANFLPRGARYFGYRKGWYDGPLYCFGFWLFHVYVAWEGWPW